MTNENTNTPLVFLRRRGKIKVRKYHNPERPHLRYYISFREAGKTRRMFFETERQAKAEADFRNREREQNGVEHAEFPTAWRVMAQNAMEQLEPFGKTIDDATRHYVAHLRATERSCTVEDLVIQLHKSKKAKGVGEHQLAALKSRLGVRLTKHDKISPTSLAAVFAGRLVATITTREIDHWLCSLDVAPQSRNHYRASAFSAFRFAVRHGFAPTNPVAGVDKAKVVSRPPGILTVEQASALLVNAPPELVPYVSIGLFAGLRRAELERLDWSEIDFESGLIEVKAEKSKTAMRRLVKMEPSLCEWLQRYRKLKGNVTPLETFRDLFNTARERAGIVEWPDNALRHSFASYHLAQFKNAAVTALELGHHDARMTFAHYRELVRPKEAARFWSLKPATGKSRKIVSMTR